MNNLWFAPIISVILLVLVAVAGQSIYNGYMSSSAEAINVNNISSSIALDYGYYTGEITGILTIKEDFDYLNAKIDFYDSSGAKMDNAAYVITQNNAKSGDTFNIKGFYSNKENPAKAILTVYNEFASNEPIYTLEMKLK